MEMEAKAPRMDAEHQQPEMESDIDRMAEEEEEGHGTPDQRPNDDGDTNNPDGPPLDRRIHILGTGAIGKLVAHALRGIPNPPPITLMFHRYRLLEAWEQSKKVITISSDGYEEQRSGYDVELMPEVRRQHGVTVDRHEQDVYDFAEQEGLKPDQAAEVLRQRQQAEQAEIGEAEANTTAGPVVKRISKLRRPEGGRPGKGDYAYSSAPISHLIISTKAGLTVPALQAVAHRLNAQSTICFLQNGMGILDAVNKHVFPHAPTRPNYIQGILTHGVNIPASIADRDPFYAIHAGHGTLALGLLSRPDTPGSDPSGTWTPSSRHLLRTLTRTPILAATGLPPPELHAQQLEKLAVNSIINPLTTLLDTRNGALLHNFPLTRVLRLLLAETSLVLRSLPELRAHPNTATRFSAARLETLVVSVAYKTSENISSMLNDVRVGSKTEIEFINGYIVRRGEEVGVKCVVNYAIMQAVIAKAAIAQRETNDEVPVLGSLAGQT
ncbi:hypothetical protein B0A50_06460 [Salinomyces thailandicus]|uniref:2-dehydropantoate 2-reductase n=1 Tax=Salinomyces thailandicus TaxID=706561 RepID=A0A4U0TPI8_9PEZI|nr:hypothetical protein B0A50_06460 [Salinomyces thailandica]